jgi:hypothetical protein
MLSQQNASYRTPAALDGVIKQLKREEHQVKAVFQAKHQWSALRSANPPTIYYVGFVQMSEVEWSELRAFSLKAPQAFSVDAPDNGQRVSVMFVRHHEEKQRSPYVVQHTANIRRGQCITRYLVRIVLAVLNPKI